MPRRFIHSLPTVGIVAVLSLMTAACGSSGSKTTGSEAAESAAASASSPAADAGGGATGGGLCAGASFSTEGVVNMFCDGKASAEVTLDGTTTSLTGGVCEDSAMGFAANFGVVATGEAMKKTQYFGVVIMPDATTGTVAIRLGGVDDGIGAADATLAADKSTVSVSGTGMKGTKVEAKVSCNG